MAKSSGGEFPDIIYNAFASSTDPTPTNKYNSYYQYITKAEKNFSDIKPLEALLRFPPRDVPQTTVYTIDIGQFPANVEESSFSIRGHPPIKGSKDIDPHLRAFVPGTRLRMLFLFYQHMDKDPIIFQNLASFYDINPRVLQEHHLRTVFNAELDVSRLSIHDTCPNYLPSESYFSPIQLERGVWPRRKKTTILLASNPSQDFKTILILVSRFSDCYSRNVINRDILYPTQYTDPETLETWRQPENEAETSFLRLSRLNSLELEACVSQPFLAILPVVRSHCLETSQDVYQLREHVGRFGLNEAGYDTRHASNGQPDHHWGSKETDPFQAFQRVNSSYTTSYRSLNDHLSFPWLNNRNPHMEYASTAIDISFKDVKRVMEEVTELREVLKESSALILAKESIKEARRSVEQAESVTQLTRLAFIFIPLTFATSVFGMNIDEWQEDVPRLRWFIVTALSCTVLTILSAFLLGLFADPFRKWVAEHRGFWRGSGHFIRDWTIFILLTLFVTIPTQIIDFISGRREKFQSKRAGKGDPTVV